MNSRKTRFAAILMLVAITALTAGATDRYVTGFEPPTFFLGTLPGETYLDGQDGWVATGDAYDEPDIAAIRVQNSVVRDGLQAAEFSAVNQPPTYINAWRNLVFDPLDEGEPYVHVDLDFYIADNAERSEVWGMGIQSGPMTGITKWLVWNDNSITILDPAIDDWFDTGYDAARNTWHHMRTVIDYNAMTVQLFFNNQLIATVGTWDEIPLYAFASIYLGEPGSDTFYFDNYEVRSFTTTGIEKNEILIPEIITLNQNYPNPFNARTAISYNLAAYENVKLEVFDLLGRKIMTLVNGFQNAGTYSVFWDAGACPSGIYFYTLTAGQKTVSKQMTLIK